MQLQQFCIQRKLILTVLLTCNSGEQSVREVTLLRNFQTIQKMVHYFDTIIKTSDELRYQFMIQSRYYNDSTGNGSLIEPITRFTSSAGSRLIVYFSQISMIYYGNSNGDFVLLQKYDSSQFLYLSNSIYQSQLANNYTDTIFQKATSNYFGFYTNQYFEPIVPTSYQTNKLPFYASSNYDPRDRSWYLRASTLSNGTIWSEIFFDVQNNLSIAAASRITNSNKRQSNLTEVIGVHMVFNIVQKFLYETVGSSDNTVMVLCEKSGVLLTTSISNFTVSNGTNRFNILEYQNTASINTQQLTQPSQSIMTLLSAIAKLFKEKDLPNVPSIIDFTTTSCSSFSDYEDVPNISCYLNHLINITQYNSTDGVIVVSSITDEYGMDFYFIIARKYNSFGDVLVDHYVPLLIILACTVFLGTLIALCITSFITFSLWRVSRKLYHLSRLRGVEHKKSHGILSKIDKASHKVFFEIDTLYKCLDNVERVNSSFIKYIPRGVVQHIIDGTTKSARLGMTAAEMTFIFTDLVNFTNISESLSITNLLLVISRYFDVVTTNVQDTGGIVDKFIGDGVMAIFNNPYHPVTNHAEQACRASLRIVKGLKLVNKELEEVYKLKLPTEVRARIGVNTGTALVGNIGTSDRLNFTAVGDPVNISSRLESLNRMYGTSILIGEGTFLHFKGVDRLRGESKQYFSSLLDKDDFSLADLKQRMSYLLESQSFDAHDNNKRPSIGSDLSIGTSHSKSDLDRMPGLVCFFVDTICLKGKNQSVCVYALQCDRSEATTDQLYVEKMLELVRREMLEEKRLQDVVTLLKNLQNYFEENQIETDSPLKNGFTFGGSEQEGKLPTHEDESLIVEGDPFYIVFKFVSKLRERLEKIISSHENKKKRITNRLKGAIATNYSPKAERSQSLGVPLTTIDTEMNILEGLGAKFGHGRLSSDGSNSLLSDGVLNSTASVSIGNSSILAKTPISSIESQQEAKETIIITTDTGEQSPVILPEGDATVPKVPSTDSNTSCASDNRRASIEMNDLALKLTEK